MCVYVFEREHVLMCWVVCVSTLWNHFPPKVHLYVIAQHFLLQD